MSDLDVTVARTDAVSPDVLDQVRRLLVEAFGHDFSDDDWAHTLGGWHALAWSEGLVVAHAALVERAIEVGDRRLRAGYVEGVAATPSRQGEGLGTAVMGALATVLRTTFDVGVLSTGEHEFYERLGWERWQGPTFVRHPHGLVRTPDEDDGIMVLRGETHVDLRERIVCETRPGDDW